MSNISKDVAEILGESTEIVTGEKEIEGVQVYIALNKDGVTGIILEN